MKVWVEKVVMYDHLPADRMHYHVRFAEEGERYHRSCAVIVFIESGDPRPLQEQKAAAVELAYDFLEEIVSQRRPRREEPAIGERPALLS